ncbi:hypothetical protein C0989_009552 [Termitomyces sp. Mn162]|nr:hypothetical protein C0989_009552 [Termitomyces sp. Mn162]
MFLRLVSHLLIFYAAVAPWIFILYSLLVRLGSATQLDDDHTEIRRRAGAYESTRILDFLNPDTTTDTPKQPNVGAIVGGSIGGLAVLGILTFIFLKRRRRITDVEENPGSSTAKKERPVSWMPDLKSQFSPDGRGSVKLDRLRDALSRRPGIRKKAPLDNILPLYNIALPPGSTETIERPQSTVPAHVPRYPSILERGSKRRPSPPPPLKGYPDISRVSFADSVQYIDNNSGERIDRQNLRVPPTALAVPTPGRTLPGTVAASARSAGLHMSKSPSRRGSFFSKTSFKHPFIPVRNVDTTLRFPPSSPLSAQYQPSRQHLEARMEARSPRIDGSPRSVRPGKGLKVKHQLPIHEPGSSKQTRLVEALQSAGLKMPQTPRTSVPSGLQTALPHSSKHPLRSAKFLPETPMTSYI